MTKVMVTYASFYGSTAGMAGWVADELRAHGLDAWATPAALVRDLSDVDAAVIGSAVYMDRWLPDASDLVHRHHEALRQLPVWLFGSGVVGGDTPTPTAQQQRLADLVTARGSVAFGGALGRKTHGPIAGELVDAAPGDWRNEHAVRGWAREIASTLLGVASTP